MTTHLNQPSQPSHPGLLPPPLRAVLTLTTRRCRPCGRTGEHVTELRGFHHGEDHVCLACGAADRDGHHAVLDDFETGRLEAAVERDLLPADLYARYAAADRAFALARNDLAETLARIRLNTVRDDIETYHYARTRQTSPTSQPTEKSHP